MSRAAVRLGPALLAFALACALPAHRDAAALAEAHAAAGRPLEAAREMDRAVRGLPADARLRLRAAEFHVAADQPQRAIGHLEVVVNELDSGNADAWIAIADIERERENITDAYVAYVRAEALAPDDVRAVSGLALTADSLGFDAEAREAYARWARLEQRDGEGSEAPR